RVVEANGAERERGVLPGLTDAEARARCPGLVRRPLADEVGASARHALLEACLGVSPRVEDAGAGLVHVDIAGLGRLIGPDAAVGERLLRVARAVGLEARVGIAGSRAAARVAARLGARVNVLPPGGERRAPGAAALAELAPGGHHTRAVALAAPMGEVRPMLTLLVLDLEAHPPPAPVVGVSVSARVVPRRAVAAGLWERSVPTVRDLAAVLGRLAALVGQARVGAAVLGDSHRPDAHTLAPFDPTPAGAREPAEGAVAPGALVLRRLRPPREVAVEPDAAGRQAAGSGAW